jgi:hypothetical protein
MPQTVKESLQDGSWNIVELIINILPDVTTIDQKYMERLHRQALLALIAA